MAASAAATKTSGRQFEMPKIEFPVNLRELAKEFMAQTRGNYEQIETVAKETMRVLVSTQSAAAKSVVDYRAWMMKVAHGMSSPPSILPRTWPPQSRCRT
jgi:hypothetical protein